MKKVLEILLKIFLYPAFVVVAYYIILWSYLGLYHLITFFTGLGLLGIILLLSIVGGIFAIYYGLLAGILMFTVLKLNKIFIFVTMLIFNSFFAFKGLKTIWAGEANTLLLIITSLPTVGLFLTILIPSLITVGAEE
jgi:hypothetical protein